MKKDEIIEKIIELEWEMFRKVNEGLAVAPCQTDRKAFYGTRWGQFESWDEETCRSYFGDLKKAQKDGTNLPEQKYIYMMKRTAPEQFRLMKSRVKPVSETAERLSRKITDELIEQTAELRCKFPLVGGSGRPLRSAGDTAYETSVETYQLGELYTYSEKTLRLLYSHLIDLKEKSISLAKLLQENTLRQYGFNSIEEAESFLQNRTRKG